MNLGFSIVLSSFNGVSRITDTLGSLGALQIPEMMAVELILIDNASSDSTYQLMNELKQHYVYKFQITVVQEPNPGLSNARMLGMRLANYTYILFCDDDNWFFTDYLIEAAIILNANPKIGMLGGCGVYFPEETVSKRSRNIKILALGPQGESNAVAEVLYGAGVFIRKDIYYLLKSIDFEFLLSDRKGHTLSSGGDYELCYIIKMAGYELWYSDKLQFEHHFDKTRFEFNYFKKFVKESSEAIDILSIYKFITQNKSLSYATYKLLIVKEFLHNCKEMLLKYVKYLVTLNTNINKETFYFKYLYHKNRIYNMVRFMPFEKQYFERIKMYQTRLNSAANSITN